MFHLLVCLHPDCVLFFQGTVRALTEGALKLGSVDNVTALLVPLGAGVCVCARLCIHFRAMLTYELCMCLLMSVIIGDAGGGRG